MNLPLHKSSSVALLVGTAAAVLFATPAWATTETVPAWSAQVTPYIWATAISGKMRPLAGIPTIGIDASFPDLLEDLDGAFFLSGLARRDRVVLLGDLSYASASRSGRVGPGIPAEGRLRQTSLTLAAGYRAVDAPEVSLDLLGGARSWWVRTSVTAPSLGVSASRELGFTDPLVAMRLNARLAPRWSAILYADLGVGLRDTIQMLGTVNYKMHDSVFVSGGYRELRLDYDSGGTRADMKIAGPLLGATWVF